MTEAAQPGFRKSITYQSILLGGFALLAAALLIFGNVATRDDIDRMLLEDTLQSISQVIPQEFYDNNLIEDNITVPYQGQDVIIYRASLQGQPTAVAFEVRASGYAGEILLMLGIKADGSILGVRVLAHAETPGLGDKIEVQKDPWILSFNGLSLDAVPDKDWAVRKDGGRFDQFSGATITPRGVVKAVKAGLEFFTNQRETLLAVKKTDVKSTQKPAPQFNTGGTNNE